MWQFAGQACSTISLNRTTVIHSSGNGYVLQVECTRFGPGLQKSPTLLVLSCTSKLILSVVLAAASTYFPDLAASELAGRGVPLEPASNAPGPHLLGNSQETRSGSRPSFRSAKTRLVALVHRLSSKTIGRNRSGSSFVSMRCALMTRV